MSSIYSLFLYVDNPPPLKVTTASLPVARNIPAVATSWRKIQSFVCHVGLPYSLFLTNWFGITALSVILILLALTYNVVILM